MLSSFAQRRTTLAIRKSLLSGLKLERNLSGLVLEEALNSTGKDDADL